MIKKIFFIIILIFSFVPHITAQGDNTYSFAKSFEKAYSLNPALPIGILEAISYTNTHIRHINPDQEQPSCIGLPKNYGVMGLVENGKGYFRNNLITISKISGISKERIKSNPELNILAVAKTLNVFLKSKSRVPVTDFKSKLVPALIALSELPYDQKNINHDFALNTHLYSVLSFLNNPKHQKTYSFPNYQLNLADVFGLENYKVLSAAKIIIDGNQIKSSSGDTFGSSMLMAPPCTDLSGGFPYAVIQDAADPSNYSSRSGTAVSHITVHTMQGTYAGAISWFKNSAANVSAHYNMRASDGQITQMVCEIDKAWHVSNSNPYAVGIEHEGYIADASWYTDITYVVSAELVKDISGRNSINKLRTFAGPGTDGLLPLSDNCYKVKGHQHFPAQTHVDPGKFWDWDYYYELINSPFSITNYTTCAGSFKDPGGISDYSNDERGYYLIQPAGASSVTINFTSFDLESGYDYLYVYDGTSRDGELLAKLDGNTLPSSLTANSGSMFLYFYSDCGTVKAGWDISWTCSAASPTCGVPRNLYETNLTALTSTLNWDVVAGSDYYEIWVKPNNSQANWDTYTSTTNSVEASGLVKDAIHVWKVKAYCSSGNSVFIADSFITPSPVSSYYSTSCSGKFKDIGGDIGNYAKNENYTYTIEPAGATAVTVIFSTIDIETSFDYLYVYDGNTTGATLLKTYSGVYTNDTIISSGGAITFKFTSDVATQNAGWSANWSCSASGIPSTNIDSLTDWQTADFTTTFSDLDNSSTGIETKFYQVLEYNSGGYEGNTSNGFLSDDFSSLSNWTNTSGTWVLGSARQTDEANSNTNLNIPLTQGNETYLYHWRMKIGGSGGNRRAGIHFYCDNATLTNRGNSYFIYFRPDAGKVQIYDVVADSWTLQTDDALTVTADQYYDYKVLYNSVSGEIKAYQDNVLVSSWTDATPLTSANSISLRTGNSDVHYDFMRVYKSRSNSELVTIGSGASNDIRVQNINPSNPGGKINSLIIDSTDQWSTKDSVMVDVDWSAPDSINITFDGDSLQDDLDTFYTPTAISSNWNTSVDTNSGLEGCYYFIGTSANDSSVLGLTSISDTTVTKSGLTLTEGLTYFVSIYARNNAGLFSKVTSSDGALLLAASMDFDFHRKQFEISCANGSVNIQMQLKENKGIEDILVSRSLDGNNFTEIGSLELSTNDNWEYKDADIDNTFNTYYYQFHVNSGLKNGLTLPISKVNCELNSDVSVYPTLFDNVLYFNINEDNFNSAHVSIHDAVGRSVYSKAHSDRKFSIRTNMLAKGFYQYQIQLNNQKISTGKLLKK